MWRIDPEKYIRRYEGRHEDWPGHNGARAAMEYLDAIDRRRWAVVLVVAAAAAALWWAL